MQRACRIRVAWVSCLGALLFAGPAWGKAGDLDPTFGSPPVTAIGQSYDAGYAVAIDGSGRIVVAGSGYDGPPTYAYSATVMRYAATGTLDTTFGTAGKVIGSGNTAIDVAIDGSGRIVVVERSAGDILVERYVTSGVLDTSFDGDGKVTTAIGTGDDYGTAVAIDGNGRIVVAGSSYNGANYDVAVVRYTEAGALDTTFGGDGTVTTAIGTGHDYGGAVAIDGSGGIVVAGTSDNAPKTDVAVVRYTDAGALVYCR